MLCPGNRAAYGGVITGVRTQRQALGGPAAVAARRGGGCGARLNGSPACVPCHVMRRKCIQIFCNTSSAPEFIELALYRAHTALYCVRRS